MMKCKLVGLCLLAVGGVLAAENMIGKQSQNEGLELIPAKQPLTIDGNLNDWDLSGQMWSFADIGIRTRYSVKTAAMWDKDFLYLSFIWKDPTPMFSKVDPVFNPKEGWKSDAIQLRVSTSDQTTWVTGWRYTPKSQPALTIEWWKDRAGDKRGGTDFTLYCAKENGTDLGDGIEMAYQKAEDGTGYTQEVRIPWKKLYKTVPEMKAGVVFQMGFDFNWGDPSGSTWPTHRYFDNMQPGKTDREFFWTATRVWGDAKLIDKGQLTLRKYVSDEKKIVGHFPISFKVPQGTSKFTVVIEDEAGNRIRNLGADLTPEDYEKDGAIVIGWDGLSDKGELAAPGIYRARGLYHNGLGAEYEMCFYNPGTPPWDVPSGSGGWGADHCPPKCVARSGDWMILSWQFAEGGEGIIGVNPAGVKQWGEKRGAVYLAADDEFVYAVPGGWHIKYDAVIRLDKKTGAYKPFLRDGKELPLEYPVEELVGSKAYDTCGINVSGDLIYLLLKHKESGAVKLLKVGKSDLKPAGELIALPAVDFIAVVSDQLLYAANASKVWQINPATGSAQEIAVPGVEKISAISVDTQGHLLVMDSGRDQQVKAFANGKQIYTCAKKGGRAIRGDFDEQAVREVRSIAADAKGNIWAVENWNYPRRVSVWNPTNGKLVRDYIGNTGYAGTGTYLHNTDPTLAYVGPIELKLNKKDRTWKVTKILWVPDPEVAGERFLIDPAEHCMFQRFTAKVNGKEREYLFVPPYRDYRGYTLFMETPKGWQPVCAVTTVGQLSGEVHENSGTIVQPPQGEFAQYNSFDGAFWNDANGDGRVQFSECQIIPGEKTKKPRTPKDISIPMGSGWGERIGEDFVFYVNGIARYKPLRFTKDGAPVYGPESLEQLGTVDRADFVPVVPEKRLLCLHTWGTAAAKVASYDSVTGKMQWSYPNEFPGVHGSHRAPMPTPGRVIGPLKILGVVQNNQRDRIFAFRGNLGQDFFMTTDGLYVGALFQDGRLPGEILPTKEIDLLGKPMEGFSNGGEPFNGWMGLQSDGKIRITTGFPRQASMILGVKGLDSIRRFNAGQFTVTAQQLATAQTENLARAEKETPPRIYPLRERAPGNNPEMEIARVGYPHKAQFSMSYDNENLYFSCRVADDSPWRNEGKDYTRLFKTGDCVDLQLCANESPRSAFRIVVSQLNGKPVAVFMKPFDTTADKSLAVDYISPVAPKHYDRVEILKTAKVRIGKNESGYSIELTIPLASIGFVPKKGLKLKGDFGFIAGDASGTINTARIYWANKDTNLVNDLPQEASIDPKSWGIVSVE